MLFPSIVHLREEFSFVSLLTGHSNVTTVTPSELTSKASVPVQLIVHTQPEAFYAERAADMFAIDYSFNAAGSSKLVCPGKTIAECGSRMLTIASDFVCTCTTVKISDNLRISNQATKL